MSDDFEMFDPDFGSPRICATRQTSASISAKQGKDEILEQIRRESVDAFAKAHPELKPDDIPQEVWEDIFQTNNLEASYIKYQAKKTKDENAFLKKNAENKARSTGSMKSAGKPTYDEFDRMWYEDDY